MFLFVQTRLIRNIRNPFVQRVLGLQKIDFGVNQNRTKTKTSKTTCIIHRWYDGTDYVLDKQYFARGHLRSYPDKKKHRCKGECKMNIKE